MSNDRSVKLNENSAIVRAFKLWAKISMMIVDGTRDATSVANVLQCIVDQPSVQKVKRTFTVQPSLTIPERISLGGYDGKNPAITEKQFPHDATTVGEYEFDLYYSNCNIDTSSEDMKLQAEVDGWKVAQAEHVLSFVSDFPDTLRKFTIVALGSVCEIGGYRCVLELWSDNGWGNIGLNHWDNAWAPAYRFLRVRKVKQSAT